MWIEVPLGREFNNLFWIYFVFSPYGIIQRRTRMQAPPKQFYATAVH
jgi:predicted permease